MTKTTGRQTDRHTEREKGERKREREIARERERNERKLRYVSAILPSPVSYDCVLHCIL
jgi:hypothetical protein